MKLGEIIFYLPDGATITEYYTSLKQRSIYISTYKSASHYVITPYEGARVANYINPHLKRFSSVPAGKGWQQKHEVIKEAV